MHAYNRSGYHIRKFYNKLTDGSIMIELDPGQPLDPSIRCFEDAGQVAQTCSYQEEREEADLRLLAPFWRTFPLNLKPYQ